MASRQHVGPGSARAILVAVDATVRPAYEHTLATAGHRVVAVGDGRSLVATLESESPSVVVVDPDVVGLPSAEVLELLRERDPLVQVVLETSGVGATPPCLVLAGPELHGCHAPSDGLERLRLAVAAAAVTHERLAQLSIAVRLKTELIASVSHELRTPLSVIMGYIELLRDGTFGACAPEAMGVLEKVAGNAGSLLHLIEEFLDLTRIETSGTRLRRERVPLGPFLHDLAESFTLLVRTKPLRFIAELPDHLPAVLGDAAKLRVVVQNLLSNAAKFTLQGSIHLDADVRGDGRVAIRVRDTGPGIAPDDQEAIFEVFHQVNAGAVDGKGIGLGLALARRFARLMDGEIEVDSALGRGATFTVLLPIAGVEGPLARIKSQGERLGV